MFLDAPPADMDPTATCRHFLSLAGPDSWSRRMADIAERARPRSWSGRAAQQRHALELLLARLADPRESAGPSAALSPAERRILALVREALDLADTLPRDSRERLRQRLLEGLTGEGTLIPLFHLLREAARQRARGFSVAFTGLAEGTPHDLLLSREGESAELVCETVSAEEGRQLHRGDWFALVDGINPDLQTWLAAHPGRYVLKMTLPEGISGPQELAELQRRVSALLADHRRQDSSASAVLKLDPLVLAGAQMSGAALPQHLRSLFGPDAHLAVAAAPGGNSMFVMAARAGRENGVAAAITARLEQAAARRLSGTRPGIVSVFLEDIERAEWRSLRETLELEGTVRRFFTTPGAQRIIAASCVTRMEFFGIPAPDGAAEGELRFRNQLHPQARSSGLHAAIASTV
ncbi:hypothetical protein CR162_10180 [Pseudoroseomonas rhizosphaerae]|uniref:Uncharacterized protein n=1 Tax=Teichococcus rhizosphaerae TaxID=1335062 RepID=A0A2C7ACF2_9PROT|nr:hypothetical protein [Pseudoroseomonas rhizosphaerae]PHK95105.1 hypothetical protein CR162_10180 [Pseudoroseomonas rhizosphaerae]